MMRRRSRSRQHMWVCGGGGNHRSLDGSDNDSFIHLLAVNTKLSTFSHTRTSKLHSIRFANELDGAHSPNGLNDQRDYRLPSALHRQRVKLLDRRTLKRITQRSPHMHTKRLLVWSELSLGWLFSCRWILERRTRIFVSCKSDLLSYIFLADCKLKLFH